MGFIRLADFPIEKIMAPRKKVKASRKVKDVSPPREIESEEEVDERRPRDSVPRRREREPSRSSREDELIASNLALANELKLQREAQQQQQIHEARSVGGFDGAFAKYGEASRQPSLGSQNPFGKVCFLKVGVTGCFWFMLTTFWLEVVDQKMTCLQFRLFFFEDSNRRRCKFPLGTRWR